MSVWAAQEQRLDAVIDRFWGEPVELHPMSGGDVSEEPVPDSTRNIVFSTAVYMRPGSAVTGEGGTQGAGLSSQIVENDTWASIVGDVIGGDDPFFEKDDRVYWPERNEWWAITYITPSATNRPNIHLVRLNPNSIIVGLIGAEFDGVPPIFDGVNVYADNFALSGAAFIDSSPILDDAVET